MMMIMMSSADMREVARMRVCPGDMMMFMMMFLAQVDVTARMSPGSMIMRVSQSEMIMMMCVSPRGIMMVSCRGGR